jgi:hypothetical protein
MRRLLVTSAIGMLRDVLLSSLLLIVLLQSLAGLIG